MQDQEDTDLCQMVQEAAEVVRGLAEARGLKLKLDLPDRLPLLPLDRTRIRQVLLNLLTNATRFTDTACAKFITGELSLVGVEPSGDEPPRQRAAKAFAPA